MIPTETTRRLDEIVVKVADNCALESGGRALCDACAQKIARAAYEAGVWNKNAAVNAAAAEVAENARAYWTKHIEAIQAKHAAALTDAAQRIEQAAERIIELNAELGAAESNLGDAHAEIARLREQQQHLVIDRERVCEERNKLEAKLRTYGQHKPGCDSLLSREDVAVFSCTCSFDPPRPA